MTVLDGCFNTEKKVMTALDGCFSTEKKAMTALDGCFSNSGLGAEWYKRACIYTPHVHLLKFLEEDMKPFPCKIVSACRTQEGGRMGSSQNV